MIQHLKFSKKIQAILFVLVLSFFASSQKVEAGLIEWPFGGLRLATIPCTCHSSPAKALIIIFDYTRLVPLRLAYIPFASTLYGYFNIITSTYMLGSFNPYIRNSCLVTGTGIDCEPLPDDGLMGTLPGTGTSLY